MQSRCDIIHGGWRSWSGKDEPSGSDTAPSFYPPATCSLPGHCCTYVLERTRTRVRMYDKEEVGARHLKDTVLDGVETKPVPPSHLQDRKSRPPLTCSHTLIDVTLYSRAERPPSVQLLPASFSSSCSWLLEAWKARLSLLLHHFTDSGTVTSVFDGKLGILRFCLTVLIKVTISTATSFLLYTVVVLFHWTWFIDWFGAEVKNPAHILRFWNIRSNPQKLSSLTQASCKLNQVALIA